MSKLNDTTIMLNDYETLIRTAQSFIEVEGTPLSILSAGGDKPKGIGHKVVFFTEGIPARNAIFRHLMDNSYVNLFLTEEGKDFFPEHDPTIIDGLVVVLADGDELKCTLRDAKRAIYKWEGTLMEAHSTKERAPF